MVSDKPVVAGVHQQKGTEDMRLFIAILALLALPANAGDNMLPLHGLIMAHAGCMSNANAAVDNCLSKRLEAMPRNELLTAQDLTECRSLAMDGYLRCIRITIELPKCDPWADELPELPENE